MKINGKIGDFVFLWISVLTSDGVELHLFELAHSFLFINLPKNFILVFLFHLSAIIFVVLQFVLVFIFCIHGLFIFGVGFLFTWLNKKSVKIVGFYHVVGLNISQNILTSLLFSHVSAVIFSLFGLNIFFYYVCHGFGLLIVLSLKILKLIF